MIVVATLSWVLHLTTPNGPRSSNNMIAFVQITVNAVKGLLRKSRVFPKVLHPLISSTTKMVHFRPRVAKGIEGKGSER
eukprot:scaffold77_cov237-Chaetoceros_neogracile.AAC.2